MPKLLIAQLNFAQLNVALVNVCPYKLKHNCIRTSRISL